MAAKRLIESGRELMVATTVLLELEWVLRGYYEFSRKQIAAVFEHLLALPHASYLECEFVGTFDDKGFAREANKRAMLPRVSISR